MATAPPPLRPTVGNLCLGSAPGSRGARFPGVPNPADTSGLSGTRRPILDR
ncbi:hypothetical protein GCM10023086_61080 [Streptomyces venetus]|uniref:Uncharacterized protein n=1 Tax=Streptomyces venetus TaxID=1701086 RepID=A0ABP8GWJ9_9ACTN